MARVKGGFVRTRRRKRILKLAKGYFGSKHRLFKTAKEQVGKSLMYAYRDRRNKNVTSADCGSFVSMQQLVLTDCHTANSCTV